MNALTEVESVKYISLTDDEDLLENLILHRVTTRKQLCGFDYNFCTYPTLTLNENAIFDTLSLCPDLQELCLHMIIPESTVLRIIELCPPLTKLKLIKMSANHEFQDDISSNIMNAITEKCICLTSLHVSWVENEAAILNFVEKRGALLTSLSIPNSEITDVVAKKLVQYSPKLAVLDVSGKIKFCKSCVTEFCLSLL